MSSRSSGLILIMLLAFIISIKADVAPDPDEMKVTFVLTINTNEDLSDYRFFVDFSGAIHEIEVKNKGQTVVPSMGGGARYGSGTILAIPKKNLAGFPEKITSTYQEEGKKFSEAMRDGTIQGIIRLTNHTFSQVIKKSERESWTFPVYQIERDENSLKMVKIKDLSPKIGLAEEAQSGGNYSALIKILAWTFITLGIFATGIVLLRKLLKKR